LTIVLLLLTLACQQDGKGTIAKTSSNSELGTVVVAYPWDIQGVNELLVSATPMQTTLFYFGIFMPLLEEQDNYTVGPPTFAPRLAESYEFSADRLSVTLRLFADAVWSDGTQVTADDVRFTWQAHTDPDIAWAFASAKDNIRDVEVVDSHTVRFHFHRVTATQLLSLNQGVILPKHVWGKLPFAEWRDNSQWFEDHLVVSGPFTLESWVPAQRIVLRRNKSYFRQGLPKSERIVFQITPDVTSQLSLLRSGEAHLMEGLQAAEAKRIESDPNLKLLVHDYRNFIVLCWNERLPLFAETKVRQALTMAIDRQGILDSIYYGYAHVNSSPFMKNSWVSNHEIEPWPYDPGKAKELLAAEGWIDRDGDGLLDREGVAFSFEVLTSNGNQIRQDILLMVQQQLKRLGIDARPRTMELNSLLSRQNEKDFEATIVGFSYDTSLELGYFFRTDEFYNWSGYSNPELDQLLAEIAENTDQMAAKPLYDRLQATLHTDQPFTYLYQPKRLVGVSSRLHNAQSSAASAYAFLERWQLDAEE
jgi:peptide/nickel transport system substrate-binding protein